MLAGRGEPDEQKELMEKIDALRDALSSIGDTVEEVLDATAEDVGEGDE
jgi:ElaB/YqjD/DUF883 family membrane-anchored ribosome-binding protein